VLIYAHRGVSAAHPENTLLAFRRALELGVDGIELDLHASADGVPVVIHDRDLARTTNGNGNVDATSLVDLKSLDAGHGERIPTLAEVLALVGDALHLDLEIKGRGIERVVLDVLASFTAARWAISSFDWETLREVRRLDAMAELWPLAEEWSDDLLTVAGDLGSPVVSVSAAIYSPPTASEIRAAGCSAMVWTVNDPHEARRVRDLGALSLCTDDPERIASALDRG
jgi:glycerophosphoryl diester phosphodiesterase